MKPSLCHLFSLLDYNEKTHYFLKSRKRQKQMKSKLFPSEVYLLRKRVNLSSESSQLYSDERVKQIRMGKQVLKKQGLKRANPFRKRHRDKDLS